MNIVTIPFEYRLNDRDLHIDVSAIMGYNSEAQVGGNVTHWTYVFTDKCISSSYHAEQDYAGDPERHVEPEHIDKIWDEQYDQE